jgi:hypothetical protein
MIKPDICKKVISDTGSNVFPMIPANPYRVGISSIEASSAKDILEPHEIMRKTTMPGTILNRFEGISMILKIIRKCGGRVNKDFWAISLSYPSEIRDRKASAIMSLGSLS